jgi:hypothetical protein
VCLLLTAVLFAQGKRTTDEGTEVYETNVSFRDFSWGTSFEDFSKRMGNPVAQEENNGLRSLVYENIEVLGFPTYMVVYFSENGLEGGTYYFLTYNLDELMGCYNAVRQDLRSRYGPTYLFDGIIREMRPYECSWKLPGGYVYLKVNTRISNDPVTLWCSSPSLTKRLLGIDLADDKTYTAQSN